jgi:repressor LexA
MIVIMTRKQRRLYEFIQAYIKRYGLSPSYHVTAKALGLRSKSNIHRMVCDLIAQGFLEKDPRKFYAIKVKNASVETGD